MQQSYSQWLPSRPDLMLEQTIRLAEINSGTFNVAGVNAVADRLLQLAQGAGCRS